jgi:hypothetical protein
MRLTTDPTSTAFLDAVRPVLSEREAEHRLLLGVAKAAATGWAPNAVLCAASVDDGNGLALGALMTREHVPVRAAGEPRRRGRVVGA